MYPNLIAELARHGIKYKVLMDIWGVTDKTVRNKLNGITPISIKEALLVKQILYPDLSLDYLFDTSDCGQRGRQATRQSDLCYALEREIIPLPSKGGQANVGANKNDV